MDVLKNIIKIRNSISLNNAKIMNLLELPAVKRLNY